MSAWLHEAAAHFIDLPLHRTGGPRQNTTSLRVEISILHSFGTTSLRVSAASFEMFLVR